MNDDGGMWLWTVIGVLVVVLLVVVIHTVPKKNKAVTTAYEGTEKETHAGKSIY